MKGVHNPCFCSLMVLLLYLFMEEQNRPILHPRPYNKYTKLTICFAQVLVGLLCGNSVMIVSVWFFPPQKQHNMYKI